MIRLAFDRGTLLLIGISRASLAKIEDAQAWTWDPRVGAWRRDAIDYARAARQLRQARFALDDRVAEWTAVEWPRVELPTPRAEQQAAIAAWRQSEDAGGSRGVIVMPTGTGKTEVALHIMAMTGASALIVAPVRDLMYQWHRRILAGLGYDAGVIGDSLFRVRPVSVTTYDSACIHMDKLGNRFRMIVFDECHHLPGNMRRDAARMSAAPLRLGLTATPFRSDGRESDLAALIGPTVHAMEIGQARGRTLAEYEVVRIPVYLSDDEQLRYDQLSGVIRAHMADRRKTQPSFSWQDLCANAGNSPQARQALRAYHAKRSIEDRAAEKLRVLEDLFRLHVGEPCIVFAGSNAMARDVSLRFLIPCLLNHCRKKERRDVLAGLASGEYPAIVANQVLDEGVDLPDVKVAVVIGGSASPRQATQRLGRVLRRRGHTTARLYEIVCATSNETERSRRRRDSDAYEGTRHRRL